MSAHRSALLLPAALLLLAACGGAPTAPSASTAPTLLDRDSVLLARVGDEAALVARSGEQTTATPTLAVESEARWIGGRAVLDSAALAAGRIRAGAPGRVVLAVRAFGAQPARLTVTVRPARPLVVGVHEGTAAGEVELVGYRLDAVATEQLRVDGRAVAVVGRDSATLRLALPATSTRPCEAVSAATRLWLPGADVDPAAVFPAAGLTEVRLGVGQTMRLPAGALHCVRFAAQPGAAYTVAFLDSRSLRAAAAGYEGSAPPAATYRVTMAELGSAAPAAQPGARASLLAAEGHARRLVTAGDASPFARSRPWTPGERVALDDAALGGGTARVVAVYGGRVVLAVAEAEADAPESGAWLARADSAFRWMDEAGIPLLQRAVAPGHPVTSPGAGQLLVVARRDNAAYGGASVTVTRDGRRLSLATLNMAQGGSALGVLRNLAHELGHAWQQRYDEHTRPAGTPLPTLVPLWASEGTADLLAAVVLRRAMGVELFANWDWAGALDAAQASPYALLAAGSRGELTGGYASAASFQLDLIGRLVRRGVAEDEAVAQVVQGSLEGWHGWDAAGLRREGLAARMRRSLDGGWDPAAALLLWTASQAVDDLTGAPELQNPAFRAVGTAGRERSAGWLAPAVLHTGGTAEPGHGASTAAVAGNAAALAWRWGSPNYFRVEDGGRGGAYRLQATGNEAPLEQAEWLVVRYR